MNSCRAKGQGNTPKVTGFDSAHLTLFEVIGRFVVLPEKAVPSLAVPGMTAVPSRICPEGGITAVPSLICV